MSEALHWSQEAEQSVLGGLMLDCGAFDRAARHLKAASFYSPEHRIIWAAIESMSAAHKPVDVLTVFEALQRRGQADDCGGLPYLNALFQSVPSAANVGRYAEIVAERATQRALIEAADKALDVAKSGGTAAEKIDAISVLFGQIERQQQKQEPAALGRLLVRALDRYSDISEGKAVPAISTGIAPLDRLLNGGLRPAKLIGIAARPSVGKSSAARTIAIHAALAGVKTLLLSQEMPQDEVADCVIAEIARVDSTKLQTGDMSADDWHRVAEAVDEAKDAPLWVDEQGGLTLADIRTKARGIKGLGLLLLDYLQLSSSTLKGATTNDQVAEISKGLKALSMELGIPVVVLSQLNRDVEKRTDKEPQLSDLRDSGAIEQDLDIAIMLWTVRDAEEPIRLVGWKVAKHRGGRKGRFAMRFNAPIYQWCESQESIDAPTRRQGGYE